MLGRSGMNRIIAVLVVLLMGSSWQIIVHQHEIRKLNIELEKEKTRYSDLKMDFHRLELQNSKEAATDHVDAIAREKEEIEAPKKPLTVVSTSGSTNGVNPPTQAATNSGKVDSKPEIKKEDVKTTPSSKVEPKKEESKTIPVKTESKKEVKKEDPKSSPKAEKKKSEDKKPSVPVVDKSTTPVDKSDKLGELIKTFK